MNSEAVRQVMAEFGPMTGREIANFFPDERHADIVSLVSKMRIAVTKRVYIHSWVRADAVGGRDYLRAVYALGNKRCATKPPALSERERSARRRQRQRVDTSHTRLINSVFSLGLAR